ncbi:metallophosphoesterase [Candidatus Woesearchaeota archaeon]|nr:metallophosphoesterase [Candidatus Woesearchaeota archaeon]
MAIQATITPGIELIDLGIYLQKHHAVVISDIHLGFEEAMKGVMLPRFQLVDTIQRLDKIFGEIKTKFNKKVLEKIVITGDLKHEFGKILVQEWRNVLKFIDYLQQHCHEIVLIKGNHDIMLDPVLKKRTLTYVDYVKIDDILICHGDAIKEKEMTKEINTIIIGHEHCAIGLQKGNRIERYKCFLVGTFKKRMLIAMPSLNLLTIGTDVLHYDLLSPYLQGNIDNFKVYIVEDTVYDFGTIKSIKHLNNL